MGAAYLGVFTRVILLTLGRRCGRGEETGERFGVGGTGPRQEAVTRMRYPRLMDTLCVFQLVLTALAMGVFFTLLTVYLLFTPLWPVSALYLAWLVVDRNTPKRGGRRSEWVRNWRVWKGVRDYFPVTLVKTSKLSPKKNYILGYHPHGIMSFGAFCNFATEATQFSRVFPGITPHLAILNGLFRFPVFRDYLMCSGACSVSRSSLRHLLEERGVGQAVLIVVGGAAESMTSRPGEHRVLLKNRQGFVRVALEHGQAAVPEEGGLCFAPCLFIGRGLVFSRCRGLLPFARLVTTVVGKPIAVKRTPNPPQEEVDRYHTLYKEALLRLFDQHKTQYGLSKDTRLTIF